MIRINIFQNTLTGNGIPIILSKINLDILKKKIKNKFKKKPQKIYFESGEEIFDNNICKIKNGFNIVFTLNDNVFIGNDIDIDKDIPIKLIVSSSYVSSDAVKQLENSANRLEGVKEVYGMPDLHAGNGCPVGAVYYIEDVVHPHMIGSDIGCGMAFFQLETKINSINFKKLGKNIKSIDGCYNINSDHDFKNQLGTIGKGNHFAEIQIVTEIVDINLFKELHLDDRCYYMLVHSGSRDYGYSILNTYKNNKILKGNDITKYMEKHNDALKWATFNRELIAERLINELKRNCSYHKITDIFHNFIEFKNIDNKNIWIHRKGATSADNEIVIIPGSRGDFSYLVKPCPNTKNFGQTLPHGAGRKISRSSALIAKKNKDKQFINNKFNSIIVCDNSDLLYEEAPKTYKNIKNIISDLVEQNLIKVIAILQPVFTYKTKKDMPQ